MFFSGGEKAEALTAKFFQKRPDHQDRVFFVETFKSTTQKESGKDVLPMEGRSLVSALAGEPEKPWTLIFEHERNIAIREGDWKLVGEGGLAKEDFRNQAEWRLYDLSNDMAEQTNLAEEHPDKVARLKKKLLEEAKRTLVLPAPWRLSYRLELRTSEYQPVTAPTSLLVSSGFVSARLSVSPESWDRS